MKKFGKNKKRAQSLVEYGLILALVAVIAIAALQVLGQKVQQSASTAGNTVSKATDNAATAYCTSIGKHLDSGTGLCVD
jgi:Flp pilus assembly pilin Flp